MTKITKINHISVPQPQHKYQWCNDNNRHTGNVGSAGIQKQAVGPTTGPTQRCQSTSHQPGNHEGFFIATSTTPSALTVPHGPVGFLLPVPLILRTGGLPNLLQNDRDERASTTKNNKYIKTVYAMLENNQKQKNGRTQKLGVRERSFFPLETWRDMA